MKQKFKFFVTDWAPNGTNGLIVRDAETLQQVDYREEALFGVDVNKLKGPGMYFDKYDDCVEYRIPKRLIKKHVCSGPFGIGFEENCAWLTKYLGK